LARARTPRIAVLAALGLLACGDGTPVVGAGSSGPRTDVDAEEAADFGPLPDFRLTSERGAEVTLADLRGRPLVLAALFSTCTGPCPSIARGLKWLQRRLAGTDVLLVAVSVDPEVDSPAVLARYAERVGADPERWIFLTGPEASVHELVRGGFFMAVERTGAPAGGDPVTHDTRLLAVDRKGHRRGWYPGTDEHQLERLRRRMLYLASEPAAEPR
jgi:cytochrome oxidase Cu insertion factor (SCO1/SenC/PrrC family)